MERTSAEGSGLARLPHAFAEQPRGVQITVAVVVPAVLGAVSGVVLGISAPAYWVVQVLAAVGGWVAGLEHDGAAPGARRGLLGGSVYGASLLLVHELSGMDAHVSLGDTPGLLVVVTAVAGCALGALGGRRRARLLRTRPAT